MKKILYILFMASLLAASCTKEVLVSRDHDIAAEVLDITTTMDMSVLYCNINDVADESLLDLQNVGDYLTKKSADVVTLVAPATVNGTEFSAWLASYAAENGLQALSVKNVDNELCMGALLPADLAYEAYTVEQGLTFNNAVLHFQANGIHFVVTDLEESRNAIPSDWEDQIEAMVKAKAEAPIKYDPDNLANRKTEVEELINRTMQYANDKGERPFAKDKNWMWCIDMNIPSSVDMRHMEFARKDCYDWDEETEAYFTYESKYFTTPSELLTASDPYFALNDVMVKNGGLQDCFAQYSEFTASSKMVNDNPTTLRNNFLYLSKGCFNMIDDIHPLDTAIVEEWGTTHYPIMVTLKSEE